MVSHDMALYSIIWDSLYVNFGLTNTANADNIQFSGYQVICHFIQPDI